MAPLRKTLCIHIWIEPGNYLTVSFVNSGVLRTAKLLQYIKSRPGRSVVYCRHFWLTLVIKLIAIVTACNVINRQVRHPPL
jgi:hypothetical protein